MTFVTKHCKKEADNKTSKFNAYKQFGFHLDATVLIGMIHPVA